MTLRKSSIEADVTRVVEGQSYIATRQLVDSEPERELLEEMLDRNKPPYPMVDGINGVHYLLKTPFRYPPLRYGSRFGTTEAMGIFYGSLEIETALCEVAYMRFKFLSDSEADLRPSTIRHTSFAVSVNTTNGLNLTTPEWHEQKHEISSPVTYKFSQSIGKQARESEIEVLLYYSARTIKDEVNAAIFSPEVFIGKRIKHMQHWDAYVDYHNITFMKDASKDKFIFSLEQYLINKALPRCE